MKEIICKGCGSIIQDKDPQKRGYVPLIDINKTKYCKRCYRLMHYNELPKIIASNIEYENVINMLLKKNGLIVLVVDLFDFTGTFIPRIMEKLRDKDVILVANKLDLLPKSANVTKIVDWIQKMANRYFFKLDAIHVVSSKNGLYIKDLINTIDFLRHDRNVYFMGCANVGKSSLINALLKENTSIKEDLISTSPIPGTTLDQIIVPFFEDNKAFIDTPGLINENNILSNIFPDSYSKILPKKEIKPITYQIKDDNTVLIGGLLAVSLLSGENVSFTSYFSENLPILRRKTEGLDEFIKKHLGGILNPPVESEKDAIEYETKEFLVPDGKYDLVVSGLGFIAINKGCKVLVKVIKNTDVFIRHGILGQ
jgi:ribosome biogenesis GTPase YqeH